MANFTQAEYDQLRKDYALGVSRAQYGDRVMQYRSRAEMKSLLQEMAVSLGLIASSGKTLRIRYNRGL